ncbi:MAG: hypothetical protein V3S98_04960 [Dehalococcoidia bacterium]
MVVLAAVGMLAAACGEGDADTSFLVPERANLVGSANLAEILADDDIQGLLGQLDDDGVTLEDGLAEFELESGIDVRLIGSVLVFAELTESTVEAPSYFGVVAHGSFDDGTLDAIEAALGEKAERSEYRGHAVITGVEDGESFSITLLGDDALVAGSTDAVHAAIDLFEGDGEVMAGEVRDTFDALGDRWAKAALAVPAEAFSELDALPVDLPFEIGFLDDIELVGLGIDKDGDELSLNAVLEFASEDSASEAENVINAALTLLGAFGVEGAAGDLLGRIEVEADGSTLTIEFSATIDELSGLGDALG